MLPGWEHAEALPALPEGGAGEARPYLGVQLEFLAAGHRPELGHALERAGGRRPRYVLQRAPAAHAHMATLQGIDPLTWRSAEHCKERGRSRWRWRGALVPALEGGAGARGEWGRSPRVRK